MQKQLIKLEDILRESSIDFEKTDYDKVTVIYSASLGDDSEINFDIISVQDGDGFILKFVMLIDDTDEERIIKQLESALMLNFVTGLGKFAFNVDRGAVVYVVDYALDMLNQNSFQNILDEYYYFSSQYFEKTYPEESDEMTGHD